MEHNIIRDRRSEVTITVMGSKEIIDGMIDLFLSKIDLWDIGKEFEYISYLTKATFTDTEKIRTKYLNKLEPLDEKQLEDKIFRYLLLISEVVSFMHIMATKDAIKKIKSILKNKMKAKLVQKRLDELSQESSADFSIMLNLGILCVYARITDFPEPFEIFNVYFSKVIKKIMVG